MTSTVSLFTSIQQFLEQFKFNNIAINTRTQEDYNQLMNFFQLHNIKWYAGDKATEENYFLEEGSDICIEYLKAYLHKGLAWASVTEYLSRRNYTIISYTQIKPLIEEYLNTNPTIIKQKLNQFNKLHTKFLKSIDIIKHISDIDCDNIDCDDCPFQVNDNIKCIVSICEDFINELEKYIKI